MNKITYLSAITIFYSAAQIGTLAAKESSYDVVFIRNSDQKVVAGGRVVFSDSGVPRNFADKYKEFLFHLGNGPFICISLNERQDNGFIPPYRGWAEVAPTNLRKDFWEANIVQYPDAGVDLVFQFTPNNIEGQRKYWGFHATDINDRETGEKKADVSLSEITETFSGNPTNDFNMQDCLSLVFRESKSNN